MSRRKMQIFATYELEPDTAAHSLTESGVEKKGDGDYHSVCRLLVVYKVQATKFVPDY